MSAVTLARTGPLTRAVELRWPVSVAFAALLLGVWELAGALDSLPEYILAPSGIADGVLDLVTGGQLGDLLIPSLKRSLIGLAFGLTAGIAVGLVSGVIRGVEDFVELPVAFTYPLPKIALFPAFAVWLGFEDRTRILVIALACFYPAYLNAHSGTRAIDPNLVAVARNAGASRLRTFVQVIFPAALPRMLAGVRISVALSFVLLFATEVIGFSDGIGAEILLASREGDYSTMYAGIAVLAACGFVANGAVTLAARTFTHDQGPASDA